MSAARIVTTTERFDETGKLVERITEEKFTEKCECKCANQNEPGTQKASNIRLPFLPDPKALNMELVIENGRVVEKIDCGMAPSKEMW